MRYRLNFGKAPPAERHVMKAAKARRRWRKRRRMMASADWLRPAATKRQNSSEQNLDSPTAGIAGCNSRRREYADGDAKPEWLSVESHFPVDHRGCSRLEQRPSSKKQPAARSSSPFQTSGCRVCVFKKRVPDVYACAPPPMWNACANSPSSAAHVQRASRAEDLFPVTVHLVGTAPLR